MQPSLLVGGLAAPLGTGSWLPHVYRMWRRRCARDLLWGGLLLTGVSLTLWLGYGVIVRNWAMVCCDTAGLTGWGLVVAVKTREAAIAADTDTTERH
jgi:uncharacterized protein with PQ loop repeat